LFLELGAGDHSLDFPVIYASGRDGKAGLEPDLSKMENINPIFDAIVEHIQQRLLQQVLVGANQQVTGANIQVHLDARPLPGGVVCVQQPQRLRAQVGAALGPEQLVEALGECATGQVDTGLR